MFAAILLLGAALFSAAPASAPAPPPAAAPRPPTPVAEVVVAGGPVPRLASSWPASGASAAAPGVLIVKLVYDQALAPAASVALAPAAGTPALECLARPRLLADAKTLVFLCRASAKASYDLAIGGVQSASGRAAEPARLRFSTGEDPTDNAKDALQAAGLQDADLPVEDWIGQETPASAPAPSPTSPASPQSAPAAAPRPPSPPA